MFSVYEAFKQAELPDNYFRAQLTVLKYIGIDITGQPSKYYKVYSRIMVIVTVYIYTLVELLEIYSNRNDIDAFTKTLFYCITHLTCVLKVTMVTLNYQKIKNMISILHTDVFKPVDEIERSYIRKVVKRTESQALAFYTVIFFVFSSAVAKAIHSRIGNSSNEWLMPFIPISTVDISFTPIFEICCSIQSTFVLLLAIYISTIDLLRTAIIGQITAQMKIMQYKFTSLTGRAQELADGDQFGREKYYFTEKLLGECIERHLQTYALADLMEEISSISVLIEIMLNIGQLCFMLYQASTVKIGFALGESLFSYFAIAIQPYLYCHWGNLVSIEAANVGRAVADMDWVDFPPKLSKRLVIIMARAQKPTVLTAAGYLSLNFETLTMILKGSFSYCMVIRQKNSE